MLKFIIWGAGHRGKRILFHLKKNYVDAFIDMDESKQGNYYYDLPVISFDDYKKHYSSDIIIITTHEEEVELLLKSDNITTFYFLSECPEDLQHPNPKNILKNYIQSRIKTKKKYLIYGDSLYSLLLYRWIQEKDPTINPVFYFGEKCRYEIVEKIKKEYGSSVVLDNYLDTYDTVFITVEDNKTSSADLKKISYVQQENLLRLSEKIGAYRSYDIEKFKGIHKGNRCFIIGLGPSLTVEDLNKLHKNSSICFGVNSVYKLFEKTKWRPDYYVVSDWTAITQEANDIDLTMQNSICFFADSCETDIVNKPNRYVYHWGVISDGRGSMKLPYSQDCSQIIYGCGTVLYDVFQLATYMGFTEIILLGVDATGINDKYVKYSHCYDEEKQEAICLSIQQRTAYERAKENANAYGIKILNATRGGELEVFERVDFDDLFENK